jgi:hypothetical protein
LANAADNGSRTGQTDGLLDVERGDPPRDT